MPTGLRLEPVTQENVRAACKLELRPDQEGFVAPVAVAERILLASGDD
jgi:diamine N-acetyltransferase